MTKFHDEPFDEVTLTKLELFRHYIRAWLHIFLSRWKRSGLAPSQINIFDFFAGRGKDAKGQAGSALIVVQELRKYCEQHWDQKTDAPVLIALNDVEEANINNLKHHVEESACPKECCHREYTQLPFQDAFNHYLPLVQSSDSANLLIMDQFGFKEVTPGTIATLATCGMTDILFFVSSSFIHRFCRTREIQERFQIDPREMKSIEYKFIHKYMCKYFQGELHGINYYLVPFSLKKGSNIYGVIFGTRHVKGLEEFLSACWKLDRYAGEANFNIYDDLSWGGQQALWPEGNVPKKVDLFRKEVESFVREQSPDNKVLYLFCLKHGFPGKKAKEIVSEMVKDGCVEVEPLNPEDTARKSALYLSYNAYKEAPRVRYRMRDSK
ncbi:MAG: three-Cys-motif partner protein TcmP [Candidatus Hydrogenedentota bacterium]